MTMGTIVAKDGFAIDTVDPSNITLDTRAVGGMKKLPTLFFEVTPQTYTETYSGPGAFPGTVLEYGRIRIPHTFGFPPAFSGYLTSRGAVQSSAYNLPSHIFGNGAVFMHSTSQEVIVDGLPMPSWGSYVGYEIAVTIFAENLESDVV